MARKTKSDEAIEKAYYRLAQGRQIDIMKINPLFREVRESVASGMDLETAVSNAVQKYTIPA